MGPGLSIIIPVKNETLGVEENIRFLNFYLKINFKIYIVTDTNNDLTIPIIKNLQKQYNNLFLIINEKKPCVKNCIDAALKVTTENIFLISVIDEIFPIFSIEKMFKLFLNDNPDIISGTRYAEKGRRISQNYLGSILSRAANLFFKYTTSSKITDATTGFKMMKKDTWYNLNITSETGWAFALEITVKSIINKKIIKEVPFVSIDRIFCGKSTFILSRWWKAYFLWLIWYLRNYKN
jgi:hypothetical protein